MTLEQYYAAVRRLGFHPSKVHPSKVPHVYFTSSMDVYPVPDATNRTPEQRAEIIEKLKERLGIVPTESDR
jgi:hypothetical protein